MVETDLAPEVKGFPASARATAVPNALFTELMPLIDDVDELRVTLYAVYALGRHRGYPRFVTELELAAGAAAGAVAAVMAALDGDESPEASRLRLTRGLDAAVERGALLRLDAGSQALYF